MSKFVCNVEKFKGGQLYGMDIHIQRKTNNHSNKDIDVSRSKLNYELVNGQQNEHYFTAVKKRIEQGYLGQKNLRKDATLACGVLISSDKNFFDGLTEEQEKEFFKTAYDHLCEKYGKENIISAKVHKDETTPHLHAIVVPLTKDGRLTAKELFDRKALISLHNEIPKKLKERGFNIERGEENVKVTRMETDEWKRIQTENKVTVSIKPNDVEPQKIGEEKKLFSTTEYFENSEQIANRLTEKYVKPLTDELTNLKTEKAVKEKRENAIKHAKAFSQNRENEFVALYHSLKEFGDKHVTTVLEKIQNFVSKLNAEKQKEREQLAEKQRNNQFALYGVGDDLYKVIDFGKAPYEFKETGKPSYYIVIENQQKEQKIVWGLEIQEQIKEQNIKVNDFIRLNGSEIEFAEQIRRKQCESIKI